MTDHNPPSPSQGHSHGKIGYLQLPSTDVAASIAFYGAVFGWHGEAEYASFEAPGVIGGWLPQEAPVGTGPAVLWLGVDELGTALMKVSEHGGKVVSPPQLDQGERWLAEVTDPSGNRLGLVAPRQTARSQTMIAVQDVEASSRWYQQLLGLRSDHGGSHYERLLADGELVLQLHQREVEHHHGPVAVESAGPVGNGVLLWFGEVSDFDGAVVRATELGATIERPAHRNPPEQEGNGPSHRELWLRDPDGYLVVIASPDGEAWLQPAPA